MFVHAKGPQKAPYKAVEAIFLGVQNQPELSDGLPGGAELVLQDGHPVLVPSIRVLHRVENFGSLLYNQGFYLTLF